MKFKAICIAACALAVTGCGHKRKTRKDILHAPDELLVQTPLSLAGSIPDQRDDAKFNRCITGDADPDVLASCQLPYLTVPGVTREEQVESILGHTLISHDWQKERFKTFLQATRPEIISMLSCVKGIAISTDIRPSFYYPSSAAIYLDARYFAANAEEANTVSKNPDSREENFDQIELLFFTVDTVQAKSIEDSRRLDLEGLLAHELAHACDFKAAALTGTHLSDALPEVPDNAVYHLAQWLFFGEAGSKDKLAGYTPADIGKSYEDGPVIDIYGYGNQYEHLAMIVQNHLGFEFDGNNRVDLLTNNPKDDEKLRNFPIHWGMTGKFCQPDLFQYGRELTTKTVPMKLEFQKSQTECVSVVHPAGKAVHEVLGLPPQS
ncbi:MAG TPA: hypothetical protein VE954_10585 [Oligoflexus sp.]|uniref:hypothetical protein n=1 Tax=Oligoflexus sp. TaxID=1971216 RepID=UPI002D49D113|nr:hypothetical protein [Oligoflexus sp.]HYX33550.1 hypothetical protein [Oligoflexus sp.]